MHNRGTIFRISDECEEIRLWKQEATPPAGGRDDDTRIVVPPPPKIRFLGGSSSSSGTCRVQSEVHIATLPKPKTSGKTAEQREAKSDHRRRRKDEGVYHWATLSRDTIMCTLYCVSATIATHCLARCPQLRAPSHAGEDV